MNTETLNQLKELKLEGMAEAYKSFLSLPLNQRPSEEVFINQLIESEKEHRLEKRKKMYLRLSKLRYQANIYDIDCSEKRNLSKDQMARLTDCL